MKFCFLFLIGFAPFFCFAESLPYEMKVNPINVEYMVFDQVNVQTRDSELQVNGGIKLSGLKTLPDGYIEIVLKMKNRSSEIMMASIVPQNLTVRYWSRGRMRTRYLQEVHFQKKIHHINSELDSVSISFIQRQPS